MRRIFLNLLSKAQKNRLRSWLCRLQLLCVRFFQSYAGPDLLVRLRLLGIRPGDSIMVHCAYGEEFGFRGSMSDLIAVFREAVGPDGHLWMVSMPYSGSASEYLAQGRLFDVRKTPSAMGLITEAFRRQPGVQRSANPMHPVLVAGPDAATLVAGHEHCVHSCGPGTPFERLLQRSGKVIFFNTTLKHFTFFHYLEHRVAGLLPFPLYREPAFKADVNDAAGVRIQVPVHGYSAEAMARRRDTILHEWLEARGVVRRTRIGATRLLAVDLQQVVQAFDEMTAAGRFFYTEAAA
jgi:aminoglycoside 3-N-acetyltransferase